MCGCSRNNPIRQQRPRIKVVPTRAAPVAPTVQTPVTMMLQGSTNNINDRSRIEALQRDAIRQALGHL